ncbi:sigma factor [Nonomuraea sp. KM90]|uniref:sigma factor n=1 Tax=Nonomuraea sp. KM90 TaxID=3457428 RepID=UPI003FCDBB6C
MDPEHKAVFPRFVAERSGALFRAAYPLTGDRHAAEDLVQSALAKTAANWRRLRDPTAARTVL